MKKKTILLLLALVSLGACLQAREPGIKVLATFAPIYSLTKNVAGTAAEVEMLLPPNIGPHDFAFSPSELARLSQADVIVSNGLDVESWLDKAIKAAASGAERVVAGRGIKVENPHIWLDPVLAIQMVENIRDGLRKKDPARAGEYEANAAAFIERLAKLDADIREATANIQSKRMVTFHNTFEHFARRYGFEVVGVVAAFPGKEPTPKYLRKLRDTIVAKKVEVLFSEPQYSPRLLESLAADLKVPIVALDPMETGEKTAELYESVMRANLKALTTALK